MTNWKTRLPMQQISEGAAPERYTLYFPIMFDRLANEPDLDAFTEEIGKRLGSPVEGHKSLHSMLFRTGSFGSELEAKEAFHHVARFVAGLSVSSRYPIYFEPHLAPLEIPDVPLMMYGSEDPVDARSDLRRPQIIPEHLRVCDFGALFGFPTGTLWAHDLQAAPDYTNSVHRPISERVHTALHLYRIACAAAAPTIQCLGFVMCLESLCSEVPCTESELRVISAIQKCILDSGLAAEGGSSCKMVDAAIGAVDGCKRETIARQLRRLVQQHKVSIEAHMPEYLGKLVFRDEIGVAYNYRSRIVHDGWFPETNEEYMKFNASMEFVRCASKGILLSLLASDNDFL